MGNYSPSQSPSLSTLPMKTLHWHALVGYCFFFVRGVPSGSYWLRWLPEQNRDPNFKFYEGAITGKLMAPKKLVLDWIVKTCQTVSTLYFYADTDCACTIRYTILPSWLFVIPHVKLMVCPELKNLKLYVPFKLGYHFSCLGRATFISFSL